MTLAITETWIRDRVQLKDENLEDVKSLSLPGTYHEKISQLGNALLHFSRLKELDLSRNALESLDGLQHLNLLESLNLYYNNIGMLSEVHKLRYNSKLQELDLRLNPVARNEPDYRLFAIHMLPNLRRLDDRGVRDQERKAALMHFGTDQAAEFADHRDSGSHGPALNKGDREVVPRAEYVAKLNAVPPVETDDTLLIDYAQGLDAPRQNGGSRASESYDRRELLQMERENGPNPGADRLDDTSNSNNYLGFAGVIDQYYPTLKGPAKFESNAKAHSPSVMGVPRSASDHGSRRGTPPPSVYGHGSRESPQLRHPPANNASNNGKARQIDPRTRDAVCRLCDLVDRYWNGSRSLHNHPKFLPTAVGIMAELGGPADPARRADLQKSHDLEREVDELRLRLRRYEAENQRLREAENQRLREDRRHDKATRSDGQGKESVDEIERDNDRLRSEVNTLRVKLRAFEQTNELANMLRESHKALVETNDQLMRELADVRGQPRSGDNWHGARPSGPYHVDSAPASRPDM